MRLRENVDILKFLEAVKGCSEDVYLETEEGDKLNLKSVLSQYLFVVIGENRELLAGSSVDCSEKDMEQLSEFVQ